jgi:hypothetical protein
VDWQKRHVDVWPVFELRRHRIGPASGRDEDKGYTSLCQNFSNGKYRLICKVDVEERGIDIHSAGSIQPECSLLCGNLNGSYTAGWPRFDRFGHHHRLITG